MSPHTDPNRRYEALRSRDNDGWWFVREYPYEAFIPRMPNWTEPKEKYYQTEYAAREAAAVLNLQVEVEKRLKTLANEAVSHG